jgi:hypothetical protein
MAVGGIRRSECQVFKFYRESFSESGVLCTSFRRIA